MPADTSPLDCNIVELRQYTLHPGQRDVLIDLFERELIEPQEALGMTVMGQFRDLGNADRFVWLRGFQGRATRRSGLGAFYGGPVWRAHRGAANATMIDSDNVLLLRPAWPGSGLASERRWRSPRGAMATPGGVLSVQIVPLRQPATDEPLASARALAVELASAGTADQGCYVTDPSPNDFPALPVRENEHLLVLAAMFADAHAFDPWAGRAAARFAPWVSGPVETLRLVPTARSAIRSGGR